MGPLKVYMTRKFLFHFFLVIYRISLPISPVIFSVFDTEIWEIFHEKRGSSYSRGLEIQEQLVNSVVSLLFLDNTSLLEGLYSLGSWFIAEMGL